MSEEDAKKDEVTFTDFKKSVEIKITVTPKIRTELGRFGPHSSLHFLIECDGENQLAPSIYHWAQRYGYYGEREGEAWKKVEAHWLAQYHYVIYNIKYALMHKADWLCGEAAVAQWDNVEWEPFFDELYDHLHELDKQFAGRFPAEPGRGMYSDQAEARMEAMNLGFSDFVDIESRLIETPRGNKLARLITAKKDTRAKEIKQLWADQDVLKRFARLVQELKPVWSTIRGMADPCDSEEEQDEWLSEMEGRPLIQAYKTQYPNLSREVMRRVVDSELKDVDRESTQLAYFHAILELKVQVNGDTLTIYDAYVKYEGKPPAPTTLKTYHRTGRNLLLYFE